METTIRVPYSWTQVYTEPPLEWSDLLCWTMETFGLPGDKFTFHPKHAHMEFVFADDKDALMFQLKTGCQSNQND